MISQLQNDMEQAIQNKDYTSAYLYASYLDYYRNSNSNTSRVINTKKKVLIKEGK